jgi:hypothetical protein
MRDLELLLHFNTSTGPSIASQNPLNSSIWSTSVPQRALSHPFLMHGIFAISALHLAYLHRLTDPTKQREYEILAAKHESIALPMFRDEARRIERCNCDVVFAFSALVVVYAMASPGGSDRLLGGDEQEGGGGGGLLEWLLLLRGVDAITRERHGMFGGSPLEPLINLERFKNRVLQPTDEIYLDALGQLFVTPHLTGVTAERSADLQVYRETLSHLRLAYTTPSSSSSQYLPNQPVPYIFFTLVPKRYLELLRKREPEALVLLAYECVILKRLEPLWFVDGVADRMMRIVMEGLGKERKGWVEWPLREMGLMNVL